MNHNDYCYGRLEGYGMLIELPDQNIWRVPVEVVACSRATYYAKREYDGDVQKSLYDDTIPLFLQDPSEIVDWAKGDMDWEDLRSHAYPMAVQPPKTFEDWPNFKFCITAPVE